MPFDERPDTLTMGHATENMTMAELIECVKADGDLSENRKRNIASSIRRFCSLLDFDPETTRASFRMFQDALKAFSFEAAGITERRIQNIKSDVSTSLKRYATPKPLPKLPLSNAWKTVQERGCEVGLEYKLSGLINWCNAHHIAPDSVTDAVIARYRDYLEHGTFKSNPKRRVRAACLHWNKLSQHCQDIGMQPVTLPNGRKTYRVTLDDLHPGFRAQLEDWLRVLSTESDLFDLNAPNRALKQASIDTYQGTVLRMVGALVKRGHALSDINALNELLVLSRIRDIIEFFIERSSVEGKVSDRNVMHVLKLIARHCEPNNLELRERLLKAASRVNPGPRDMGARPKNALHQFDDPDAADKLISLPPKIIREFRRKETLTRKEALLFQCALILELLLMRPIRLKNLRQLKLGESVLLSKSGARILIHARDVKNVVELDYTLPDQTVRMLREYIERALPAFGENPNQFLFPGGKTDAPKAQENISKQLGKFVHQKTGLFVTVHLMRQIAGHIYLQQRPEDIETVRQVLAHKSIETTIRSYVGLQNQSAIDRYDSAIMARRRVLFGETIDD